MSHREIRRSSKLKIGCFVPAVGLTAIILFLLLFPHQPQWNRLRDLPTLGICSKRLSREILDRSLEIGTQFMLNNQKPEGNFNYEYHWIRQKQNPEDSQVRQAGALWGLTLIYQDRPTPVVAEAIEKALAFFERLSRLTPDGARYIVYPGDSVNSTGTVALCALAHIDYLRAVGPQLSDTKYQKYQQHLDEYLKFLVNARTDEGVWYRYYRIEDGQPFGEHTPYFDGESLLALVKAAKYLGRDALKSVALDAAQMGYRINIRDALRAHPDSRITKGYYQWSSMAFFELATSGWPDTEKYGDYVLDLADWMIDVHRTLQRTRNTAYAYEGIIHAYELAVQRQDTKRTKKLACVIDTGLEKLTSWQVGGPIPNKFIRQHGTDDPLALGGVQNHRSQPTLRIDVTQHQMHAVILARRYVYKQ